MKKILTGLLKKYSIAIVAIIILISLNMFILTIPPRIIGKIIDLLEIRNKEEIIKHIIYLLLSSVAILLIRIPWKVIVAYITRGLERDLKNRIFEQFTKLSLKDINSIKNGELMSHFVKDAGEIRDGFYRLISLGTRVVAVLSVTIFAMFTQVNIKLTLITIIPIFISIYLIIVIKDYIEKTYKKVQENFTDFSEYVQESTDAIRTIKAYSSEGTQLKEFIRKNKKLRESNNTLNYYRTLLTTCLKVCFGLAYGISIIYGSNLVIAGKITTGEFITFNGYIGLFINPVSWIPGIISRYKRAQLAYKRLDRVFSLEREKINLDSEYSQRELKGNIEIKDLSFTYPENFIVALEDININIKKGTILGIIGTIGSGKTTLMNLLLKLYKVPNGKILYDGIDINDIPVDVIRRNICYITQDNFLFSTTLKDNISLFKEEYDDKDIRESMKKSMIYDEVLQMDDDIYTIIGERGVDLSGGQKQRVAISRAFLNNCNIIVFDDAFSALDNKTEEAVLNNVYNLARDKCCIIISNRISDIKNADEIIVLDSGKICERGKHEKLLNNKGLYYKFYCKQSSKIEVLE